MMLLGEILQSTLCTWIQKIWKSLTLSVVMRILQNKVLRSIGESHERFREDPVRILRAIRFKSKLDLSLESNLEKECIKVVAIYLRKFLLEENMKKH